MTNRGLNIIVSSLLLLGGAFVSVSHAQQEASPVATSSPMIPADENSLATHEDETLEQELQFLNTDNTSTMPVEQPAIANDDDKSLTDTLTEGLKSIFSEEGPSAIETPVSTDPNAPAGNFTNHATLQGLNKITARTSSIDVALNEPVTFGTLEITVHRCWKSAPEEMRENEALMEIWEQKPGEEKTRIFNGWMFSSTPSISALENPVYDVTVIECSDKAPEKTEEQKVEEGDKKEAPSTEKSPS
jgi:hypothetical protein